MARAAGRRRPCAVGRPGRLPPDEEAAILRFLGNVIWLVLAGLWLAIAYVIAGVANCLTIIGIPFGIQHFKLIPLALFPFGRELR